MVEQSPEQLVAWLRSGIAYETSVGAEMANGTSYAGISPESHKPMYTTARDAPPAYSFNEAANYANQLNAENYLGHDDWRVPTKNELNLLFNNRVAIGGFNLSGSAHSGCYWSSSESRRHGNLGQSFSSGSWCDFDESARLSLRCVRG